MPEDYEKLRVNAMDRVRIAEKLADKKYFTDLVKAVRGKKKTDFEAVCGKAGIPDEMRDRLWILLSNSHAALYAPQAVGPIW